MDNRWCNACGVSFLPRPQAPTQAYCTQPQCQKERRRLWQQAKRRSDPDYLSNQARAQKAWARRNPDYWKSYREENAAYTRRNRKQQRERNARDTQALTQTEVPSLAALPLPSGLYQIRRIDGESGRKMDVWIVQLTMLSSPKDAPQVTK